MKHIRILLITLLGMMVLSTHAQILSRGVTKELVDHRKANISNVIYDLTFNIPADMNQKVTGSAVICFDLKKAEDIILDFQGEFNGKCSALVPKNKKKTKFKTVAFQAVYQNEHIIIPKDMVVEGSNRIELNFTSLDKALNRNQDYLYTIFVPDLARSVFPCFDQPDLRAMFRTKLNTPAGWKTMVSDTSGPLPTFLYSFVAGNFYEKTRWPNSTRFSMRLVVLSSGWKAILASSVPLRNMVSPSCLTSNCSVRSTPVPSNSTTVCCS